MVVCLPYLVRKLVPSPILLGGRGCRNQMKRFDKMIVSQADEEKEDAKDEAKAMKRCHQHKSTTTMPED